MRVIEPAGYDNFLVEREDTDGDAERHIVHVSFLVTYYYPKALLKQAAADIAEQVDHERADEETASACTSQRRLRLTQPLRSEAEKRGRRAARSTGPEQQSSELLVELRRRRRRNRADHYVLEFELRPVRDAARVTAADDESQWVSIAEYDRLLEADRVVEDSVGEEGV
ncbi:hypothetical protein PF003_g13574 [Phytophthora fragariae]|nr:hypothetical protein PF003_g13574 [Phytophthora fragariae]